MKRVQTQLSYAKRIERVVCYLSDHLDSILSLDEVACVANLSPYHFHRVYRAVMGETVNDSTRRLRLNRAANDLIRSQWPLERIAKRAGYGSAEAFSRAFAADYGMPPAAYRQARPRLAPNHVATLSELSAMYDVTITTVPTFSLAAIDHAGDYQEIGRAFDRLSAWAGARGLLGPEARMFGIYFDDPASVPQNELRSQACLLVAPGFTGDGQVKQVTLEACTAASLIHKGPYAELENAYHYLYKAWLPTSGREPLNRPCFEEYLNNPRELPPSEWLTQVFMPLK